MTVTIETLDGRVFRAMEERRDHYCKVGIIGTAEDICIPKINVKKVCEEAK